MAISTSKKRTIIIITALVAVAVIISIIQLGSKVDLTDDDIKQTTADDPYTIMKPSQEKREKIIDTDINNGDNAFFFTKKEGKPKEITEIVGNQELIQEELEKTQLNEKERQKKRDSEMDKIFN